jgi:hypothetical protein
VADDSSKTSIAWPLFDQVIAEAKVDRDYSNPWVLQGGDLRFQIDERVLTRLLGVPLMIKGENNSRSGILALALDVWAAYELRRAGFEPDAVWPREAAPRVLPLPVANLLAGNGLTKRLAAEVRERIDGKSSVAGVAYSSARILGKLYPKQVDAGMASWETGPEIMISTKRMDGSFGKNLGNRAEESYGDAKNLRLRHPMAAIGFLFGLRSTVLTESGTGAKQVIDRLTRLELEDDAYDATCLVMLEYDDATQWPETPALEHLIPISIRWDAMREHIGPNAFFTKIVKRVLEVTPEDFHANARDRMAIVKPDTLPQA